MELPVSLQPRVPWWHPAPILGYLRRVTGSVPEWNLPDRKVAELYAIAYWREGPIARGADLLKWEFFMSPWVDARLPVKRSVKVSVTCRTPGVSREQLTEIITTHSIQTGLAQDFLDGRADVSEPGWRRAFAKSNEKTQRLFMESQKK